MDSGSGLDTDHLCPVSARRPCPPGTAHMEKEVQKQRRAMTWHKTQGPSENEKITCILFFFSLGHDF